MHCSRGVGKGWFNLLAGRLDEKRKLSKGDGVTVPWTYREKSQSKEKQAPKNQTCNLALKSRRRVT